MSTQSSILSNVQSSADNSDIQVETLPPISSQQNNIPGTDIPDKGVPEGGYPNSHNHYSPENYNPNDYAQSDSGIFGIPSGVNPFIDPKMEKSSISGLPDPDPRLPLF